ncbi:ABC transporter ATP-binding protein [Candidatus Aenigmatarchaeota archaeon]
MKEIIKLQNVWKIYKMGEVNVDALRGITLTINAGEFVAITGPSGSGKSTLMHILGSLDLPTKGKVFLDGKNIAQMSESELAQLRGKKVGFIFQQFNLLPTFTAIENVMLPLELQDFSYKQAEKEATRLLTMVGLRDRMNHLPKELSGGQQQRVSIARALAGDPDVILADEPTGNLDSKTGKYIMDLLGKLHKKEKKTILLVTHDRNLVKHAHRVVHIKDGYVYKGYKAKSSYRGAKK